MCLYRNGISNFSPSFKENIADLYTLAQRYHEQFKEKAKLVPSIYQQMENIFNRAMENSKEGIPTIIDSLAVVANQDVVTRWNKFMDENNFSCPTIIALAHFLTYSSTSPRIDVKER